MRLFLPLLSFALLLPECQNGKLPPPSNVASAPVLGAVVASKDSKISANAEAAEIANLSNPDGPPKSATAGAISVVRSLAGPANAEDRAVALALVNKALTGKLIEAQNGWEEARHNATALLSRIDALETQVAEERVQAANDLQAKLKEAENQANAARKKWITIIFMGFGAIGVAGGVVMFVLLANPATAASYAFLGPKAAFCSLGAGLTLIATGIAVNAIESLIEAHPYVFLTSISVAVAFAITALALTYSNHKHAQPSI